MKSVKKSKGENKDQGGLTKTQSLGSVRSLVADGTDGDTGKHSAKVLLKPTDQVTLDEKELAEDFTRILNANNPKAAQNIARYNFKERLYKATPNVDHQVVHFDNEGHLMFIEDRTEEAISAPAVTDMKEVESEAVEEVDENGEVITKTVKKTVMKNQFNFSDRATQTLNHASKERSTNTEPPPQKSFCASVTQWEIFDAYVEDEINKEKTLKEKSKATGDKTKGNKEDEEEKITILPSEVHSEDVFSSQNMLKCAKSLERMANQNTYDDVSQDFKYWEDASDEFREGKGTLLPLWTFVVDVDKKKQVTAICWNPTFTDLFAIGYGSYEFMRQGPGMLCCFSLKNPSYPEFIYQTDSGVMCLDFHKQNTSFIAVGMYDGSVAVYDLKKKARVPIYKSSAKNGKHYDPVWQVMWGPDDLDGNNNFYSISSDGTVMNWTLLKTELVFTEIIKLKIVTGVESAEKEVPLFGYAAATCMSFSPTQDHLFVVGTEEGHIHKCSKTYHNVYLNTFDGHQMNVYAVKYNPFNGRFFLSASADWTVKLWDHDQSKPVLTFDLNSPVGDIAWAPYSSTVFATATANGKIYVYDLNENKYEPICEQQIIRKGKLTHIAFNPSESVLLVGDDKGTVVSLKLSPNLRKRRRASDETPENERLEKAIGITNLICFMSSELFVKLYGKSILFNYLSEDVKEAGSYGTYTGYSRVNDDENPMIISNDYFTAHVVTRIRDYSGYSGLTTYFNGKKRKVSLQIQGRFHHRWNMDDIMFGNFYQKPLRLPHGISLAVSVCKMIDPSIELNLTSTTPALCSPLITCMNIMSIEKSIYRKPSILPEWRWGGEIRLEENVMSFLKPNLLKKSSLIDSTVRYISKHFLNETTSERNVIARRKFFSNADHRKESFYEPENVYSMDFFSDHADLNKYELQLGIRLDIESILGNQPIHYEIRTRNGKIRFFAMDVGRIQ